MHRGTIPRHTQTTLRPWRLQPSPTFNSRNLCCLLCVHIIYCQMREEIIEPNIKYSKIGESRRTKLIDLVIHQGLKVRRASKLLKINQSTAKSILKLYKEKGSMTSKTKIHQDSPISSKKSDDSRESSQVAQNSAPSSSQKQSKENSFLYEPNLFPQLYYYYPDPCVATYCIIFHESIVRPTE